WQPKQTWHFPDEPPPRTLARHHTQREILSAWVPWVLLTLFVFLWGLPQVKSVLDRTALSVAVPGLHQCVCRPATVAETREPEKAEFSFNWLSATGTGIFLAALVSSWWLAVSPARFLRIFVLTCYRMRWPLFTIACMLAIAFTTRYSGMDATLGLAFTKTGW